MSKPWDLTSNYWIVWRGSPGAPNEAIHCKLCNKELAKRNSDMIGWQFREAIDGHLRSKKHREQHVLYLLEG